MRSFFGSSPAPHAGYGSFMALLCFALVSWKAQAAALDGSLSRLPAGANVRLSSEGSLDWIHWGLTGPEDVNRKAGVEPLIGTITVLGDVVVEWFDDNATGYTWSDGDPTAEADNATAGIYVVGQDTGFEFSVPADTVARTLKVYVGAYNAAMRFEADLSDNSAPAYLETSFRNVEDGPNAVFTLNYSAASAGQKLRIRFTVGEFIGTFGNVTLQAATLTLGAPAIELVRPASDALFYQPSSGLEFRARTLPPRSLATNQLRLLLNDTDVTSRLVIAGTETARTATLPSLDTNVLYRAQIVVTDDANRSSTNSFTFDTFNPAAAIVIEAEDYNYGNGVCDLGTPAPPSDAGGLYQDNPPVSGFDTNSVPVGGLQPNGSRVGYLGAVGLPGIDFNDVTIDPTGGDIYRPCDPVVTGNSNVYFAEDAPDLRRERFLATGVRDFVVSGWEAGDWLNYTRTFAGKYRAYLRAAATGDERVLQLARVTSDRTKPDQTTEPLGTFALVRSGLLLSLRTIPLADTTGATGTTVSLDGVQTLRLTALDPAGNISVNYLVFVPEQASAPATLQLTDANLAGGNFSFAFVTESNKTYAVEFRESLSGAGAWQRLQTVTGDGSRKVISRAASTTNGFYRVVVP